MLRRNNGYFLVELLLSLSTWILVTGCLLPLLLHLYYLTDLLQLENTANHLLFDELESNLVGNAFIGNKTILLNGTQFAINWNDDAQPAEVCVEYNDIYSNFQKICKSPE